MAALRNGFLSSLRNRHRAVIGMIHLPALPGAPAHKLQIPRIIESALSEVEVYHQHNVDAVIIENMHDRPYLNKSPEPAVTAVMAVVCHEIKRMYPSLPFGVQILSGCNREALAVAMATGGSFIRAEGFVYSHIGDEGWLDSCAGELLRYRRSIGAEEVGILTDIKKKHSSHAVTADITISETAKAAEFFCSDGIIITGSSTGDAVNPEDLKEASESVKLPIVLGSGVTCENVDLYAEANAYIIGSHFKKNGVWYNPVDPIKVKNFMSKMMH